MQAVFDERPEGWTPAEWALRYVWNEPGVSLLLSGMNEMQQVVENIAVAERGLPQSLSAEELAVYDERAPRLGVAHQGRLHRVPVLPAVPVGRRHPGIARGAQRGVACGTTRTRG